MVLRRFYFEVEVNENDHLSVARLEERVLDVVEQNVHFVASNRSKPETCNDPTFEGGS